MSYNINLNCDEINWEELCDVIKKAGLATHPVEIMKTAFENSYLKVFIFDNDKLIGTGRAISDGAYQAAIYDIAVLPEYQKKGIGKIIMEELHSKLAGFNIILYANPTAEKFYRRLGYSKMLTGMGVFKNDASMRSRGFID